MKYTFIFLMDVSLTGSEQGRSTVTRFKNLATYFSLNEHNTYWISCRGDKKFLAKNKYNSINDFSFHSKLRTIYPLLLFFQILFLYFKKHPIKIISFCPSLREGLPPLFINLFSLNKVLYYIDYMDLSPYNLSLKPEIRFLEFLLEKTVIMRAKKISVISPFLTSWVRALGVSPNMIHLIPLSISDIKNDNEDIYTNNSITFETKLNQIKISEEIKKWIQQVKTEPDSYLIGYQGSIHPHQGLDLLLAAFSDEKLNSFHLLLSGGASTKHTAYENKLGDQIKKINSNKPRDKIKITGYLRSKDIQPIISLFDYGIVPKPQSVLSEATFPSKALRYLIEGIPIVSTPSGWLKELTLSTEGLLTKGYTANLMVEALLSIKGKEKLKKEHKEYIYRNFNPNFILSKWIRFLSQ
ncbi:MAG: glycosyltransferase [Candidatus Hodarchaeota archaeon]